MKFLEEIPPLPEREPDTHKGTYGRILLIAGSEGMTGAAILSARAAYRSGAGLVTVGIDCALFGVISSAVPEAIFLDTSPLLGNPSSSRKGAARPKRRARRGPISEEVLNGYDAVLLGPGLGTERSRELIWWVLESRQGPLVLDADGLNAVASEPDREIPPRDDRIWTPHPGEFARLTGELPRGDLERIAAAERFIQARGGVLVLKGHHTVVLDADAYAVNGTGNPGLATAGSGDVLSGMIAAFLGQGMAPFAAARTAVHLHGRSGDLAAADLGEISLVAGDLVDYLPGAIREHPKASGTWKKD